MNTDPTRLVVVAYHAIGRGIYIVSILYTQHLLHHDTGAGFTM